MWTVMPKLVPLKTKVLLASFPVHGGGRGVWPWNEAKVQPAVGNQGC